MATLPTVLSTLQLKNRDTESITLLPLSLDSPHAKMQQQNDSGRSAQKKEEVLSRTSTLFSSRSPLSSQRTSLPKRTIGSKRPNNESIERNVTDKPKSCRLLFSSERDRNEKLEQEVQSYSFKRLKIMRTSNQDPSRCPFTPPLSPPFFSLETTCNVCIMARAALNQGDLCNWNPEADALTQAIKAYSRGIEHLSKIEGSLYDESLYFDLTLRLANAYMARANTLNAETNDKKLAYFYYQEHLKCEEILRPYSQRSQNPHMIEALRHLISVRTLDKEEFKQKP